ncbi:MAG TPA: SAF domain-containing protein [Nocardioidaceae bacterium]|nr:SAF domain-containing protein [Nocardioidaceae bacterium]
MNAPTLVRRVRRRVLAHRRALAALCAVLAVGALVRATAAPPPPVRAVPVAAHDLAAGTLVQRSDLTTETFTPGSVPAGTLLDPSAAVGRRTAGPVRAGEPLTDVRLLDDGLLAAYPGTVAAPVRIDDRGQVALLRVGDRIDILAARSAPGGFAADGPPPPATVLARDVPVIAIPPRRDRSAQSASGALVVVAVPDKTAAIVAGASVSSFLSVVLDR